MGLQLREDRVIGGHARSVLDALEAQGIECQTIILPFPPFLPPGSDELAILAKKLAKRWYSPPSPLRLLVCTPPLYPDLVKPEAYNIGFSPWESDRIPPAYERGCRSINELWVCDETQVGGLWGIPSPQILQRHPMQSRDILCLVPWRREYEWIWWV